MGLPVPSRMASIMSPGMSQQGSEVEALLYTASIRPARCEAGHKGVEASMQIADVLRNKVRRWPRSALTPELPTARRHGAAQHRGNRRDQPDRLVGIVSERDVSRRRTARADLLRMPVPRS